MLQVSLGTDERREALGAEVGQTQNEQEESKKPGRGSEAPSLSHQRELQCPQLEASPNGQTRRPGVQASPWDRNGVQLGNRLRSQLSKPSSGYH